MRISLRRLLSKLTVLALSASPLASAATVSKSNVQRIRTDEDVLDFDDDTPIDREQVGEHDAAIMLGRGLATALSELPALDAIHLATTWALSEDHVRRTAVARSLEWMFPLVGDSIIIDHLSRDTDPEIRAASARAAWIRRPTGGDPGVLERLAHDLDPEVRSIALHARR
ncbi:MAG: hypothetical protein ABI591_05835 [Kofleriaceae bacterium]